MCIRGLKNRIKNNSGLNSNSVFSPSSAYSFSRCTYLRELGDSVVLLITIVFNNIFNHRATENKELFHGDFEYTEMAGEHREFYV